MPSFCPKLESTIKVMHRRMAKNEQKITKICFSRELSLKSGKINFHEFWTIFGLSRVHHLKKSPKNEMDLRGKNVFQFFVKNTGFLAFLVPYLQEKFIKMKRKKNELPCYQFIPFKAVIKYNAYRVFHISGVLKWCSKFCLTQTVCQTKKFFCVKQIISLTLTFPSWLKFRMKNMFVKKK